MITMGPWPFKLNAIFGFLLNVIMVFFPPGLSRDHQELNEHRSVPNGCQTTTEPFWQITEFIQNSSIVPLFLVVFIVLGLIPFMVFATFVSSSFLVLATSAFIVLGGTFMIAIAAFLIFIVPAIFLGGGTAVFLYLTFYAGARILQITKHI